jgi:predicted PurR-regulated permease PerM/CheY-like chemotaxis protein
VKLQPTILAGTVLAVACLYWARVIFIPIALAMLITFLLSPVVGLVRRSGLGQVPAVIVVVSLTCLLAGGLGWGLFTQFTTLANDLPHYRATIARKIADVQRLGRGGAIAKVENTANELMTQIERADSPKTKPIPVVVSTPNRLWQLSKVIEPVGGAVFVLVLVTFMLVQQRELRARLVRLLGQERLAETTRAFDEAAARISGYLVTYSGLNAGFGVTIALGLFFLDMPFPLVWGFFAAMLRFIPYVGAWTAALIPIATSLAVFDGWTKPLLIAALFASTEVLIAFVLEPLFYARTAGVSAIALLIAAAFWTWLWGPIGLALAIPLTVCLVVFSRAIEGLEFIEVLVSDDPGLPPHVVYYQRALAGDEQDAAGLLSEAVNGSSSEAAYDAILVPALARARHDREIGQLAPAEYAHVIAVTRQVLERGAQADRVSTVRPLVIAGCPLEDDADRVVLEMLDRVLEPAGCTVQTAPTGMLGVETLATRPQVICLSSMEGDGRVRDFVQRLSSACPDVPILVGCWGLRKRNSVGLRAELARAGAEELVTSLAEARAAVIRLTTTSPHPDPEPAAR